MMNSIHKHYYKQVPHTQPPPPASTGGWRHPPRINQFAAPVAHDQKKTNTPAIVAQFGATCKAVGTSYSVSMLDRRQQPLLTPGVSQALQYYCKAAKQAQTRDMSHLKPTPIYWKGDASTGIVSLLGIKRGLRVYNLLSNGTPPTSAPAHDLKKAKAFGAPTSNSPWAVFLDDTDNTNHTFRFGLIQRRRSDPGTAVIVAGEKEHKKEYTVFLSLVAPAALSFTHNSYQLQHIPPNGQMALAKITKVLNECRDDEYVRTRLMDAKGALEATKRLDADGKLGKLAIQELQSNAEHMQYVLVHMRQSGNACATGSHHSTYIRDIEEASALMNILACRALVSDAKNKPDILYGTSDEDFIRELADMLKDNESFDKGALKCMSIMKKFRPRVLKLARQSGLEIDYRSKIEESFDSIEEKCASSAHDAQDRTSAQSYLKRLAKDKNLDIKLWRTALTMNSNTITHSCKDAAEDLVSALKHSECRNEYLRILRDYGQNRDDAHAIDTRSLANEVMVLIDSKDASSKILENRKVADCLLVDESGLGERMEAKLRAATPSREDAATLAEIDKDEAIQLDEIVEAQIRLKKLCEHADTPSQRNNPILRGTASSGLLASLLARSGKIDIVEGSETASEIETDLAVAGSAETREEKDARLECKRYVLEFDKDARNRLCTTRIMRKLGVPPSTEKDLRRFREKLARLWRRRVSKGTEEKDEHEEELDEICVQSLSPIATGVEQRANATSTKECGDERHKSIVKSFCASMADLGIPVNFLDFLSILCLSVLPPWPYNRTTMQQLWLPARQATMKAANGSHAACDESNRIIEIHAQTADGSAFSSRDSAMLQLLQKLRDGSASLTELSKCACNSKDVMTTKQRQELALATSWYWKCGDAIITGADDARLITSARQNLVTDVIEKTVKNVSLYGSATLNHRGVGDPAIVVILWNRYLQLMFGGVLDQFRRRIIDKHQTRTDCILAMFDTFFYVVLLDLHDVSQAVSVETKITDMAGLSTLSKKNAAIGALGLAVLGNIAGTVLDEEAFETVTDRVVDGAVKASTTLLQATVQEIVKSPKQQLGTTAHGPQERAVTRGYKKLYSDLFPYKKGTVHDVLIQLCTRDSVFNKDQSAAIVNPLDHTKARKRNIERIMLDKNMVSENPNVLAPPLCFPLSPPGAGDPSNACLGVC